ncbi:hypothetical protein [Chenggangzhangella methanolivorans]|uniref:Secreted protein n=1 Tax=Chenggangzhangella methanolivorans TaxID=1437009 RepID=A0A9E6UPF2_9HYPH|nr:hypothetical protein [Chenggangzhangella methanolivorans]QZO01354.1 hypothetical protein K6K41_07750 [Chenggangzhangella methanolivorans]
MKSALLALAAAVAILALSEGGGSATETSVAKADRIAAPRAAATSAAGVTVDAQARTTTIERGATAPLSPDSPFLGGR